MTDLESMLQTAAESEPVTFDAADVRRRVERRRRTRTAAGAVVFAVVLFAGFAVVTGSDDDSRVASESGMVGALTVEELTADRWVPAAYSAVTTGADGAFVEFGDDGSVSGLFGCELVTARWSVVDGEISFDDVDDSRSLCDDGGGIGFAQILRGSPVAQRFDGDESLSIRDGDDFVAFRRFDRLGPAPTPSSLEGTWANSTGDGTYTFRDDGSVVVSVSGLDTPCQATSEYRLDGDSLTIATDQGGGIECDGGGVVGGAGVALVAEEQRARIENAGPSRLLWLSSDFGVTYLRRVEPQTDAEAEDGPDQRSAKDVAESVMDDVFGVSAVTMEVEDDGPLTVVTMEVDGQNVVARLEGSFGAWSVVDIASSDRLTVIGPAGDDGFRVAFDDAGRLTVKAFVGEDEPRSDQIVFNASVDVDGPGQTERYRPGPVTWITAELVTDRGPTLYLLSRR